MYDNNLVTILKWGLKRVVYMKKELIQLWERVLYQPESRFLLHPWHAHRCPYRAILFYAFWGRVFLGLRALFALLNVGEKEIWIEGFDKKTACPKEGGDDYLWPLSPFVECEAPDIPEVWYERLSAAYLAAGKTEEGFEKTAEWERIATAMQSAFIDQNGRVAIEKVTRFRSDPARYRELFNDGFAYVDPEKGYLKNYLEGIDLILSMHRIAAVVDPAMLASVSESKAGDPLCIRYRGRRISEKLLYHALVADDILSHLPRTTKREVIVDIGCSYGGLDRILKLYRQRSCIVMVDLPEPLLLAGYYIRYNFPHAKIALADDWKYEEAGYGDYDFILIPPAMLQTLPKASVDLVLNTASMGFMAREYIDFYLHEIERLVKPGGYFYSLNKSGDDRWGIGTYRWEFRGSWLTRSFRFDNRFAYPQWLGQKVSPRLRQKGEEKHG